MVSVFDVAKYILQKTGQLTTMKLQKLVYYSQAWHLVWEEEPLFHEKIEAWANGPVVPELFAIHRGQFYINENNISAGDVSRLSSKETSTIDVIIDHYNPYSSGMLSDLTHSETPWKAARARAGVDPDDRCSEEILLSEMAEYYESL